MLKIQFQQNVNKLIGFYSLQASKFLLEWIQMSMKMKRKWIFITQQEQFQLMPFSLRIGNPILNREIGDYDCQSFAHLMWNGRTANS